MARTKKDIGKETMYDKIMPTIKGDKTPPPEEEAREPLQAGVALTSASASLPMLVNLMERLVTERLDSALGRFNCCKCDRCKKDIAALALNKLPPKYVVVEKNMLMELLAKQANLDVTTALIQAILLVRDNPRH